MFQIKITNDPGHILINAKYFTKQINILTCLVVDKTIDNVIQSRRFFVHIKSFSIFQNSKFIYVNILKMQLVLLIKYKISNHVPSYLYKDLLLAKNGKMGSQLDLLKSLCDKSQRYVNSTNLTIALLLHIRFSLHFY